MQRPFFYPYRVSVQFISYICHLQFKNKTQLLFSLNIQHTFCQLNLKKHCQSNNARNNTIQIHNHYITYDKF